MSDQKPSSNKDLTNLLDYSKAMQESGQAPPPPEGSVMEMPEVEKIDDFESLDDYSKTNPAADPLPDEPVALPATDFTDFPVTPPEPAALEQATPDFASGISSAVTGQFADVPLGEDGLAPNEPVQAPPPPPPTNLAGMEPTESDAFVEHAENASTLVATPPPPTREDKPSHGISKDLTAIEKIRRFAQTTTTNQPAAFPFSLLITGTLKPDEQGRLTDILDKEAIGITADDLSSQFKVGKILIPRISEYSCVMIAQALRGASVLIRVGPSDEIFSTSDTREDDKGISDLEENLAYTTSEASHPAEAIPITQDASLPGMSAFTVIDALTASAALRTETVEAERSSEYQEVLESLQRELKFKAFHKGATAVVNFTVTLSPLTLPTHYRLLAMGSAIRPT